MNLKDFYLKSDGAIRVSPDQGSRFAKQVADDFNPLHNADSKRFCVPGDLLFSLALAKYGLSSDMCFSFVGMVGNGVGLVFPDTDERLFEIKDAAGKRYLRVERRGDVATDSAMINALSRRYVAFSGHNFPDILVPLLAEHGVMIHPDRPLVMYESMSLQMERLDIAEPKLALSGRRLELQGKRAQVFLDFEVSSAGEVVGKGSKKLLAGGLREYEEAESNRLITRYAAAKAAYAAGIEMPRA